MPKISLTWLVKCIIIIFLFVRILEAASINNKKSLENLSKHKSSRSSILLKSYPFLKNKLLTKDMESLINEHHNRLKRQKMFENSIMDWKNGGLKRKRQNKNIKNLRRSFAVKNLNIFQIPSEIEKTPKNSPDSYNQEGFTTVKPMVVFNNFLPPQVPIDHKLNSKRGNDYDLSENLAYDDQYYDDNVILPNAPSYPKASILYHTETTTKTTSSITTTEKSKTSSPTTREPEMSGGNFFNQKSYQKFVEDVAKRVAQQINPKRDTRKSQNIDQLNDDQAFLEKIFRDVDSIQRLTSLNKNNKSGFSCDVNGSWITTAGGMRIDISMAGSSNTTAVVSLAEKCPSKRLVNGFLGDTKWCFSAQIPFPRSGLIILSGFHKEDKRVAAFIGECRNCENSEMITGQWLLARTSHDCKDQKATQQLISDVWRRENLHVLRALRLAELHLTENPN